MTSIYVEMDVDDKYYEELSERYSKGDIFLSMEEADMFRKLGTVVDGGLFST